MRNKLRRLLKHPVAGMLAMTVVFGAGGTPFNVYRDHSGYAVAADTNDSDAIVDFDPATGVLTIGGNITRIELPNDQRYAVKKVVAMEGTVFPEDCYYLMRFPNCETFDLANADTSKVKRMEAMFWECKKAVTIDMTGWNTSNVTNMKNMFHHCDSVKDLDVSSFDTSKVTNMVQLFEYCISLQRIDLSNWDTSSVTDMTYLFNSCYKLTDIKLNGFDTSNVRSMDFMFRDCWELKAVDVSSFDTSSTETMFGMFSGCKDLEQIDVSNFNTSNVIRMDDLFAFCDSLRAIDVTNFDTSNCRLMSGVFKGCSLLKSIDLSNFDTSAATTLGGLFSGCLSLKQLDLSKFDTSNCTAMYGMFENCVNLTELDLSSFDTSSVKLMSTMFKDCTQLREIDLSSFRTDSLTLTAEMFEGCNALVSLDLSGFDMSSISEGIQYGDYKGSTDMFNGALGSCKSLVLGENFGDITEKMKLPNNKTGWANANEPSKCISGDKDYAVIQNEGRNEYCPVVETTTTVPATTTTTTTSKPMTTTTTTTTTTEADTTTAATTSTVPLSVTLYGDFNLDNKVDAVDASMMNRYMEDPENNPASEQSLINGDVYKPGTGLTPEDSEIVLMYYAKLITELPTDKFPVRATSAPPVPSTVSVTTAAASSESSLPGDANDDGKVNVADAVAVLQYIANKEKYPLTASGIAGADCDGVKGITGGDAIYIQKLDAGII